MTITTFVLFSGARIVIFMYTGADIGLIGDLLAAGGLALEGAEAAAQVVEAANALNEMNAAIVVADNVGGVAIAALGDGVGVADLVPVGNAVAAYGNVAVQMGEAAVQIGEVVDVVNAAA
jgi:hypothetical protein